MSSKRKRGGGNYKGLSYVKPMPKFLQQYMAPPPPSQEELENENRRREEEEEESAQRQLQLQKEEEEKERLVRDFQEKERERLRIEEEEQEERRREESDGRHKFRKPAKKQQKISEPKSVTKPLPPTLTKKPDDHDKADPKSHHPQKKKATRALLSFSDE